jgi:excinuclease ABC subunit A
VHVGEVKTGGRLVQNVNRPSGGEAQRVKLATELAKVATGNTLYILDEPTTGLHFADVQRLLDVLDRLVDAGNTVIVIEHNLDVIKTADRIIDLGPEGGEEGGNVLAIGTPEEVAATQGSYTGEFLTGLVEPHVKVRRTGRRKAPIAA